MQRVDSRDKVGFTFYNHDSGVFFDERKKRFTDFKDMDRQTYMDYYFTAFTSVNLL